jgi:Na+-driven multidrug efflux pump
MSFTFPAVLLINNLAHAVAIGASAVISRAIGKRDQNKVKRLTTDSIVLSLLFVSFIIPVGLLTIDPLFNLLGASSEIMSYIRQYMTIWYLGVVFIVVPMVGTNAIRASGDTKTPALIMMFAALAFLGGKVGSVFSDDLEVISVTALYLSIVPIGYGLYGVLVIATSAMSVLKKPDPKSNYNISRKNWDERDWTRY